MFTISESIQSKITLALKIFLMGMVRQFLAHTVLTYGLKLPSFLSFIWIWKEIIIAGIWLLIIWFFRKNKEYRKKILENKIILTMIITIIISIIISLATTIWIHNQNIIEFAISAKFNYIPLIIFVVGIWASYLLTQEQNQSIISTAILTIKWVLIFSLFRYGILHTIPNILDRIGFSQPGLSIERTAGTPPPSLWLTEFYTWYVRNQWPFWWPLSLGFYLAAMRPLFYGLVLHQKKLSDTRGRRLLYIGIIISTYSRAARGIFLISCIFIMLIRYRKYTKYIITLWITAFVAIAIYIAWWGTSELFLRTRSDKGHIEYFFQWLNLVKQNWIRGIWAASVGPASNHIADVEKVFNPENQYMQIWLEYGLLGIASWLLSYIVILFNPIRKWFYLRTQRTQQILSWNTIAYMGIGISIIALSIAGMVLHPFVDSSSIYPFMLMSGIIYGYYHQYTKYEKQQELLLNKKEKKKLQKQLVLNESKNQIISLEEEKITKAQRYKRWFLSYLPYIWTILISIFFIIQTFITFGIQLIDSSIIMSTGRDALLWIIIGVSIIWWRKHLGYFFKKYRHIIVPIIILIWTNIGYIITSERNILATIAWIKYDIFQFIILWAWIWLWYLLLQHKKWKEIYAYIRWFFIFSLYIIVIGLLRQIGKNIIPEVFFEYLWYSSPSDFVPYTKPPIYYITGAGGIERLSWFFVWPNTLWFFLILVTSLLYYYGKYYWSKKYLLIAAVIYILIAIFTFSRWAIIGITFQILILIGYEGFIIWKKTFTESNKLLFSKKTIPIIITIISSAIILFSINIWKQDSNNERINSKDTINHILSQPIPLVWYGPGYVGPARHYDSQYLNNKKNDYAMLENIFIQTIINQWWLGFIMFLMVFISLFFIHNSIRWYLSLDRHSIDNNILITTQYMWIGLLGLLIIGWFLHIFIDSMVNYLFFLPYGVLIGYSYWLTSLQVNLPTN